MTPPKIPTFVLNLRRYPALLLITLLLMITACQEKNRTGSLPAEPEKKLVVPGNKTDASSENAQDLQGQKTIPDSPVLATVNGEAITEADRDFSLQKIVSSAELMLANKGLKDKILQSLIAARAMKQQMQVTLSQDDQQLIQQKIAAFEEALYIKAYLKLNARPEAVTQEKVKDWYAQNQTLYGAVKIIHFEQLSSHKGQTDAQRQSLLKAIETIRQTKHWSDKQNDWQQYALRYLSEQSQPGQTKERRLSPTLQAALNKLKAGETSEVIITQDKITLLRVSQITQQPAQPLSDVSAQIRNTLVPMQLKKAIKEAVKQAIQYAEVVYIDEFAQ